MSLKTNKKLLSSLMVGLLAVSFLSSCKKDKTEDTSTPTETTVKQDQDNIIATSTTVADDVVGVINTQAVEAGTSLGSFMNKSSAFGKKGDIKDQVETRLRMVMYSTKDALHIGNRSFAKTMVGTDPLDFNSKTGTYTWNNQTQGWDSVKTPTDKVVIIFPADTNKPTVNNATLTVSAYSETLVDSNYMPTHFVSNLTVDGTEFANLNYTGTFNADGIPVSINLNLFVKPYTFTVLFNNQTTTVTADVKLTKDGQTVIGVNGTLAFVDATQKNIKTIDATIQLNKLSVTGSVNVAAMDAIQDPTAADANNNIKVAISYDGKKAGDVVFEDDSTASGNGPLVLIKFKDGSKQKAEDFFANVIKKVEDALKEANLAKK